MLMSLKTSLTDYQRIFDNLQKPGLKRLKINITRF